MNESLQRPDEELFRAFVSGDDGAYLALVDRHSLGLYDFSLRSTMDETQAADVTRSAFERLKASREIPPTVDFRTWLYSLALVEVLAISNDRRPARVSVEDRRFLRSEDDYDAEMILWAWQAARGLRTRDYCVLDLTLRRKMTPEALAESASLTRSNLYASIGRARGAFEETFGATVLYMRGRRTCPDLDAMVTAIAGGSVRPALRHQIADHADACDACRKTMAALPLASEVYVSLMDVDAPSELQAALTGKAETPVEATIPVVDATALGLGAVAVSEITDEPDAAAVSIAEPVTTFDPEPEVPTFTSARRRFAPRAAAPAMEESFFLPVDDDYTPAAGYAESPTLSSRVHEWLESVQRAPIWALGGVMTVVAIYLALAVGDSIRPGGGDAGAVPLQATAGAGGQTTGEIIECGPAPIALEHGTESVVSFDSKSLDGFSIGGVAVVPNSAAATPSGLRATADDGQSIRFQAAKAQSTSNRTDEYLLNIDWRKGSEIAASQCPVNVRVSAAAP